MSAGRTISEKAKSCHFSDSNTRQQNYPGDPDNHSGKTILSKAANLPFMYNNLEPSFLSSRFEYCSSHSLLNLCMFTSTFIIR